MVNDHAAALIANLALHLCEQVQRGALADRMASPKPGDLVVVAHAPQGEPLTLVGVLLREEPVRVDALWNETWDEDLNGPCPTEPSWLIRLIDGSDFRWVNVSPMAVPIQRSAIRVVGFETERKATIEEQVESLFRWRYGGYGPLSVVLRDIVQAVGEVEGG